MVGANKRGAGRPKGVPNKITTTAKETIQLAAEGLGGLKRLVKWAQSDAQNERIFWGTIYPKLLPHQITGVDGAPLSVSVVQFVKRTEIDQHG